MKGKFLLGLFADDSVYSIKKVLSLVFSIVVVYLVIFTDKNYYEILIFIAGLLGVRAYEKSKGVSGNMMTRRLMFRKDNAPESSEEEKSDDNK